MHRFLAALSLLFSLSCASSRNAATWSPSPRPVEVTVEPWSFGDSPNSRTFLTAHYAIHTTLSDSTYAERFANVMEGAYDQYRRLVPTARPSARPMDCYLFANRPQWASFTRATTGASAPVYLSVRRGAYTIGDRYVAYYLGDLRSFAIASHEGFHQFAGRHFLGRLPAFLEEGIASMFETVRVDDAGNPQWNLAVNLTRAQQLRDTVRNGRLYPLAQLFTMHAGNVVNEPPYRVDAFYSQSWAFARFLCEAENARYFPAFQKLLSDTAAGTAHARGRSASPATVRPMIEHYLGLPLPEIERRYLAYVQQLAFKDFPRQWRD